MTSPIFDRCGQCQRKIARAVELDESFWANAELVEPDTSQHVTLRIKKSILKHFKAKGAKGYQTRINAVLESYVRAQEQKNRDQHRDH